MSQQMIPVRIRTNMGDILVELNNEKAPNTVANFLRYMKDGHYNGTIFHRVIDGFMIQGGGFEPGLKQKPAPQTVDNEAKNGLKNVTYSLAMARTSAPHSASAQFFINVKDNTFLDYPGQDGWGYAVFGQVVAGMDVVDKIKAVATYRVGMFSDVPREDIIIESVEQLLSADGHVAGLEINTAMMSNPNVAEDGMMKTSSEILAGMQTLRNDMAAVDLSSDAFSDFSDISDITRQHMTGANTTMDKAIGLNKAEVDEAGAIEPLPQMADDFVDELLPMFSFGSWLESTDLTKFHPDVVAAQKEAHAAVRKLYMIVNNAVATKKQ